VQSSALKHAEVITQLRKHLPKTNRPQRGTESKKENPL